jgi:hypothetical protein
MHTYMVECLYLQLSNIMVITNSLNKTCEVVGTTELDPISDYVFYNLSHRLCIQQMLDIKRLIREN